MAGDMNIRMLLDIVEELVYDKNEVVTYELISRVCKVHVNVGKQLLCNFIQNHQPQSEELHVCYLVAGVQVSDFGNRIHKLLIVPDQRLEDIKQQFMTLTSVHAYSIQKTRLQDESSLYITHMLGTSAEDTSCKQFSAVNYKKVQLSENKHQNNPNPVESHATLVKKTNSGVGNSPQKTKQNALFTLWKQKETTKKDQKVMEKVKQENINTFKDDKGCKTEEKQIKQKDMTEIGANKKKTKDVAYFFNKQAEVQKKKNEMPICIEKNKPIMNAKENQERNRDHEENKSTISMLSSSEESDDDEDMPKVKKLRRITSFSDSGSEPEDNQTGREDEEEPIPPTPPPTEIKRFCRTVTKTYTDEDGFMVTKKIKEYVSEPEDCDKIPTKKAESQNLHSDDSSQLQIKSGPKKQALLMSFFGKK